MIRKFTGTKGLRFFKLKYITDISTDGSGVVSQYIGLNNPATGVLNGTGSVADWTNVSALFDLYRVHAVKLRYVPGTTFNNDSNPGGGVVYRPMSVVCDYDQATQVITNFAAAAEYENCKIRNGNRPWSYYVKVPKNARGDYLGYITTASPQNFGVICVYASGWPATLNIGAFVITYYLSFKHRV